MPYRLSPDRVMGRFEPLAARATTAGQNAASTPVSFLAVSGSGDIFRSRSLLRAVMSDPLADTTPLFDLMSHHVNDAPWAPPRTNRLPCGTIGLIQNRRRRTASDRAYMNALCNDARDRARNFYPWSTAPPGLESPEPAAGSGRGRAVSRIAQALNHFAPATCEVALHEPVGADEVEALGVAGRQPGPKGPIGRIWQRDRVR
jgi:hypothetical protein